MHVPIQAGVTERFEATPLIVTDTLAVFTDARGLSVGPDESIFVTDVGAHTLSVIRPRSIQVHGGPGTSLGQFDEPLSVDPSSGLVILVADAGNGRIQRFSREFRPLGAVAVDAAFFERTAPRPTNDPVRGGPQRSDRGRPVAVVTSATNELFVVDESAKVVLKWDASLRPEQVLGGFGSGEGRLVDPIDLATDGHRYLFVLDPGQNAVAMFDLFGSFLRRFATGLVADARSMAVGAGRLLVTLPHLIHVYNLDGTWLGALNPSEGIELVHAYPRSGDILLLTEEHLLVAIPGGE